MVGRTQGTCDNLLTIKRPFVEACVLNGLRHHLMDPARTEVFCQEYTRHLNEARMQRSAATQGYRSELDRVNRDLDRLVQAILDGVPGSRVKDRMAGLEARKAELEAVLAEAVEEPVLLHPNMAEVYRAKVARLVDALNDEHDRTEAAEVLRGLIDRIVLTPKEEDGRQSLSIDLEGALAGVLALATNDKRPLAGSGLSVAVTTFAEQSSRGLGRRDIASVLSSPSYTYRSPDRPTDVTDGQAIHRLAPFLPPVVHRRGPRDVSNF